MTRAHLIALIACSALAGCGGETTSSPSSSEPGPAEPSEPGAFVIPMAPKVSSIMGLMLDSQATDFQPMYPQSIAMAHGGDYPNVLRVALEDSIVIGTNFVLANEGLTLASASSADPVVDVEVTADREFELTAHEPGATTITLKGDWSPPDGEVPGGSFEVDVEVLVKPVAGVRFDLCLGHSPYALAGAGFSAASLHVLDENGESFYPWNASYTRPATVTVYATPDTELSTIDGLSHLVADGPEQTITLRSESGEIGDFELIHPERVDAMSARFYLTANWTRGSELVSGETYVGSFRRGESGLIDVTPRLFIGDVQVCSPTVDDLFELRSLSPDTCPVAAEPVCTDDCINGQLPVGADLLGAGACELELVASALAGGDGITTRLDVDFAPVPQQ